MSRRYRGYHAWFFMIFPRPFTQFQGSTLNIKTLQPLYTSLTVLTIDNTQYKLVRMTVNEQANISYSQTECLQYAVRWQRQYKIRSLTNSFQEVVRFLLLLYADVSEHSDCSIL